MRRRPRWGRGRAGWFPGGRARGGRLAELLCQRPGLADQWRQLRQLAAGVEAVAAAEEADQVLAALGVEAAFGAVEQVAEVWAVGAGGGDFLRLVAEAAVEDFALHIEQVAALAGADLRLIGGGQVGRERGGKAFKPAQRRKEPLIEARRLGDRRFVVMGEHLLVVVAETNVLRLGRLRDAVGLGAVRLEPLPAVEEAVVVGVVSANFGQRRLVADRADAQPALLGALEVEAAVDGAVVDGAAAGGVLVVFAADVPVLHGTAGVLHEAAVPGPEDPFPALVVFVVELGVAEIDRAVGELAEGEAGGDGGVMVGDGDDAVGAQRVVGLGRAAEVGVALHPLEVVGDVAVEVESHLVVVGLLVAAEVVDVEAVADGDDAHLVHRVVPGATMLSRADVSAEMQVGQTPR